MELKIPNPNCQDNGFDLSNSVDSCLPCTSKVQGLLSGKGIYLLFGACNLVLSGQI
jgi:hypothetical protein